VYENTLFFYLKPSNIIIEQLQIQGGGGGRKELEGEIDHNKIQT